MNKDVIYIDTEDDITAIIGKIKGSREKIVALVPPKRIGVLQSAVNLKLLARMAETSNKHLVLVTSNKALIGLSSMAKIPVARNLQSKPEIAELNELEIDDGEDIIEGKNLPIGELARTADNIVEVKNSTVDSDNPDDEDVADVIEMIDVEKDSSSKLTPKPVLKSDKGVKIPNFVKFRRRLFIGVILGIGLIGFLVWALMFAPAATVIVTAKTSDAPVSMTLTLGGTAATDVTKNIVQTVTKQLKKEVSVTFTATGVKKIGVDKASTSISISNCDYPAGFTLPIGTKFTTDDGYVFVSTAAVAVPGYSAASSSTCKLNTSNSGVNSVAVVASEAGSAYNNAGVYYNIDTDEIPEGSKVNAIGEAMTNGTDKTTTVVSPEDIQKASQALVDLSTDSYKKQLISQFTNGESVIADSFTVVHEAGVSVPALGAEATAKATLTSQTTFSVNAIAKSELETYLKAAVTKQLDAKGQRLYDDGIDTVKLSGYFLSDTVATVNVSATGKIGPNIDKATIIEQVKGLKFGDAQAMAELNKGVSNVDIKFSYFWVTAVPNDAKKIDVQFILDNA